MTDLITRIEACETRADIHNLMVSTGRFSYQQAKEWLDRADTLVKAEQVELAALIKRYC